jgi:hypothetical protein
MSQKIELFGKNLNNKVLHMTIARQRLGNQLRSYALNNKRTSISMQRSGKHPYELLKDGVFRRVRPEAI